MDGGTGQGLWEGTWGLPRPTWYAILPVSPNPEVL